MNPLNYPSSYIKYDKEKYDTLPDEDKKAFPYYCPEKSPYLCTFTSENYGLCKRTTEDCELYTDTESELLISAIDNKEMLDKGSQYGYSQTYLTKNCGEVTLDVQQIYDNNNRLPYISEQEVLTNTVELKDISDENPPTEINNFSIMTYNIWGLVKSKDDEEYMKFFKDSMEIRMNAIIELIKRNNPDIICIQEMTNMSYNFLKNKLSSIYPYSFEENFDIEKNSIKRNRNVDLFVFSKFLPSNIKLYSITGNLGYNNCFMILEFQNIVIFNCYLQAGSKFSPGQESVWFHYSRCRKQELRSIGGIVEKYVTNGKACIMVGDFNCNLSGDIKEWPEIKEFQDMKMIDTWSELRKEPGYTEDTDINLMRWNVKFQEKRFRYDGIFYRNPEDNEIIKPINIKLTGRKPIILDKKMSEKFIKYFVPNTNHELIRYYDQNKETIALWPSDHFAVMSVFNVLDEKITIGDKSLEY